MTDNPKPKREFQFFPCKGEALILLRAYDDRMKQMVEDRAKIVEEFDKKAKEVMGVHQASLRETWRRMSALVGLDPDATWGNGEYQPEVRYLAEGFGAITFTPTPRSPFAEAFGGGDDGEDSEPSGPVELEAPDKKRLN